MAYSIKGLPWQYKGSKDVTQCRTSAQVIEAAQLNWEVKKAEMVAKMPLSLDMDKNLDDLTEAKRRDNDAHILGKNIYARCDNQYCTYRDDYKIPLGMVKGKYTIVQNSAAFKFFDTVIGENSAIWQTAGFFGNGERIFVSAKLPDNILVHGDPVENYLVFTNSHDGSSGVRVLFTPIRVICQNTLNAAIRTSTNSFSIRHTESVHKNIEIAHEILGITKKRIKDTEWAYNVLAGIKLTDEDVMEYICKSNLTEAELEALNTTRHTFKEVVYRNALAVNDAAISTRKLNVISDTYEYYHGGIGQKEIAGTAWGAFNAISGYYSNVDTSAEGTKRMDSLLFNNKAKKLERALNFDFAEMLS